MVEHNLAKVGVASSSLVSRSKESDTGRFFYIEDVGWIVPSHTGCVAEWLCSGLQSRGRRFDSGLSLQFQAQVAKQVDARDLKSLEYKTLVPVRFRPWAPNKQVKPKNMERFWLFPICGGTFSST